MRERTGRWLSSGLAIAFATWGCAGGGTLHTDDRERAGPTPRMPAVPAAPTVEQFARSCVLCHADGRGGAPRIGDAMAWAPRIVQGEDVLLAHTLEGFGRMPPLGYCMDCTASDFRALIRLMTSGPDSAEGTP